MRCRGHAQTQFEDGTVGEASEEVALDHRPWTAPGVRIHRCVRVRSGTTVPDATTDNLYGIGMTITAVPTVNAIRHVVSAPPGIVTYADISAAAAAFERLPSQ